MTSAFSGRLDNHIHVLAIDIILYNSIRTHRYLRVTPAMAAGLTACPSMAASIQP